MKKLFTLLWLAIAAFTFKAGAQTTTCNAEFTFSFINGNTVKFTPVTTDSPMVHHEWSFGDGSANSSAVAPTHAYLANGSYTVIHTIIRYSPNGAPVCTGVITHIVVIQQSPPACTLVVNFSWAATTPNPLTIAFTNLSVPLEASDSTTWTFGDGTNSYNPNPVHTYNNAGTYTVCLVVKKNNAPGTSPCIRYICKTVVVTAPCNLVVDFNWTIAATNPFTYEFHNLSTPLATNDSITWTFGDGSSSTAVNPVHTYANAGTYIVCLRVKKLTPAGGQTCVREICKTIIIQSPCNLVVDFNWTVTAANPLSYEFHNLSTPLAPSDSTIWSFGDGTNSYAVNPVHVYAHGGTYTVCLIVKKTPTLNSQPCVRYICKTIIVQEPCTLVVDFNWTITATNPLTYEFHNLSTPLAPTDSSYWTFGDGTNSNAVNPVHTYSHGGTYQVCLIVKKYPWPNSTPCIKYICKTIVVQEPCNIVANFTSHPDSLNAQHIFFTNTSTGVNTADTIRWTFGDGTSSTLFSPDHTYAQPGTYTVCLRIARMRPAGTQPCVSEICKTVVVTSNCNFTPVWSWQLSTSNPLQVYFTNLTPAPSATASAIWSFGDGTTANTWNATHVYAHSGRYYVCLRIEMGPNCVRYKCDSITVPEPCNIVANFTSHPDTLNAQHIFFTNTSTGVNTADTIRWTFGDGTSSTLFSPDHTYAQPGTYTVCLRIARRTTAGTQHCVSEFCRTVVITSNCNFTPAWSWQLSASNPLQANFTNLTIAPATASAIWVFGDGTTANTWNATHVYAHSGRYYVCLRVQLSPNCIRYRCDSISIPEPPPACNNQSNFSVLPTPTNSQTFTFVPAYQNPAAVYTWSFGDGTGSNNMIATHHYASAGVYTACLTVWRSSTCTSTTCRTVQVSAQPNCDSVHVYYTYQRDPVLHNKYYFVANSNFPILDQTWTIQKLPTGTTITLHQNNPSYIFPDTGYYRVCLRAVTLGGCVKEYCTTIHIEQVGGPNVCTLTAYPNPAVSTVNVNVVLTQPDMINAYMYNSLNVQVMEKHQQGVTGNNLVTFGVAGLMPGLYTIKFIYGNHICYTQFQKVN